MKTSFKQNLCLGSLIFTILVITGQSITGPGNGVAEATLK